MTNPEAKKVFAEMKKERENNVCGMTWHDML
jgi:hypothetical protein